MTDVMLVKDCGLYPSYKKIIDFTGTKSEIIQKQLTWLNTKEHTTILDVNYNKFQNKLVLQIDYEEALTYTYAVMQNITGTSDKPMFFFIQNVENLTNGIENEESSIAIYLSLDPIMTYMGDFDLGECLVNREHVDRWTSTGVKRITPNTEGLTAFNKTISTVKLNSDLPENLALCVVTLTSPYLRYKVTFGGIEENTNKDMSNAVYCGAFLVDMDDYDRRVKTKIKAHYVLQGGGVTPRPTYVNGLTNFPSFNDIVTGEFQAKLPVVDNAIVSFTLTPVCALDVSYEIIDNEYVYTFGNIPEQDLVFDLDDIDDITVNKLQFLILERPQVDFDDQVEQFTRRMIVVFKDVSNVSGDSFVITINSSDWHLPVIPTESSDASPNHEPALFMQPYISRKIVKGDGSTVLDIPDVDFTNTDITLRTVVTSGGVSTVFVHGDESVANISEGEMSTDPSAVLDVTNDQWKSYIYTSRDTDRQIITNMAWKNAIDNLIYMSYGGALVGSRSATAQPLYEKGRESAATTRHIPGLIPYGSQASLGTITDYTPGSYGRLTGAGARLAGATGLAAGASIVTSLVDAHFMWENQKQTEKQIRNEPSTILSVGDGIEPVLLGYKSYYFVAQKVDDINYDKAYQNFKKYGYWINKFEKPDIHSRKYFNYILTNGAIITGAINQAIRDVIASIFDSGVTVFHYDNTDTNTRNLEYTNKENIEVSLL